jgi:hypothetical protein
MDTFANLLGAAMREMMKMPATIAAYLALSGVVLGTALAFGLIPPIFGGFAQANALQRLSSSLKQQWANQSAESILTLDQAKCALTPGNTRMLYDTMIQQRELEYHNLTGQIYPIPRCRDL